MVASAVPLAQHALPSLEAVEVLSAQAAFSSADAVPLQHDLPSLEAVDALSVQAAFSSVEAVAVFEQQDLASAEALSAHAAFVSVVSTLAFASAEALPVHCANDAEAPKTNRPIIKMNCFIGNGLK